MTTGEDVGLKFPHSKAIEIEATPILAVAMVCLKDFIADKNACAENEEAHKNRIKIFMGEADTLTYDGEILATWKSTAAGKRFDTEAFKKDNPELYAKYLKVTDGCRRFLIK